MNHDGKGPSDVPAGLTNYTVTTLGHTCYLLYTVLHQIECSLQVKTSFYIKNNLALKNYSVDSISEMDITVCLSTCFVYLTE